MSATFDPNIVREHFPGLKRQIDGKTAVFLDGPGGTQTPLKVIEAMSAYLRQNNSNIGGAFVTSKNTGWTAYIARLAMADLFNARLPEEIVFGQNMTSLTMAMSRALGRTWKESDEIIVTHLDHDANITPWTLVAAERGVTVKWLEFDSQDCTLRVDDLQNLLSERTKLVAVTYASNAVGSIVDVAKVCEMAHQAGALVFVDAVHYAPHGIIDVQALDCDFLVSSAYKFFGPHTGVMFGKYDLLDSLDAYKVRPAPDKPPGKWETGTPSYESLAGVQAAVEYLEDIGRQFGGLASSGSDTREARRYRLLGALQVIKQHEESIGAYFLHKAVTVPGLRVFGITDIERLGERTPTFAISLEGHTPRDVAKFLGDRGIFVWDGHYYAVAVMDRLGLLDQGGLVRIGFVHYNTLEEVDRLIDALGNLTTN
ncbi:MAG TPA: cysteine desulfurase-like protein [candidate division Zixibacteria bacterium]|nr:cysteine desulfurase-like protein [candidate division Zixibacteria bacterium]